MSESQKQLTKRIILIDTTFLFDQYSKRGIGIYGKQLLKRLIPLYLEDESWEIHIIGFWDLEKNLMQLGFSNLIIEEYLEKLKFYSLGEPVLSGPQNRKLWDEKYRPIVDNVVPNLYFAVHFERGLPTTENISKALKHKPKTAVTGHDVIPIRNNQFSKKSPIHNFFKKRIYMQMWTGVINADLVLCPSQFTKDDLVKYGQVPEEKVTVTHLGVDESFFRENYKFDDNDVKGVLDKYGINEKEYFLYDSGVEPNKGISDLLGILTKLNLYKRSSLPKTLVVTGGDFEKGKGKNIKAKSKLGSNFLKEAKQLGILENLVSTDRVSDEELKIILANAFGHLNFSHYEGFNLGPVQAMAAEVPTVVANKTCNPEIFKDGAFFVDTSDHVEAAKEIRKYLQNKKKVKRKVKKGLEIAKGYNWTQTAEKTFDAMQKLFE
jgi:hypothetical protein